MRAGPRAGNLPGLRQFGTLFPHPTVGEVSERFKEHAWKACVGETQPWVRIPPSPPLFSSHIQVKMLISENIHFAVRDAGEVSAILLRPQNAESLLVLAHGAGAGMTHPFMESLATELAA